MPNIFNFILLICVFIEVSEQTIQLDKDQHTLCVDSRKNDEKCGAHCYKVVKPLLQYAVLVKSKEKQFDESLIKVHDLETTVKHLETTIKDKEIQLELQLELSNAYKKNNEIKDELLIEKNKQLLELQTQIERLKLNQISEAQAKILNQLKLEEQVEIFDRGNVLQNDKNQLQIDNLNSAFVNNDIRANLNAAKIDNLEENHDFIIDKYLGSNCLGKLSDVYLFKVPGIKHFAVPCDSSLAGSAGWTVIHRRQDGTENFNRNWADYRSGFGNLRGEFFIGLEKLHLLTKSQPHELYIYLNDFNNNTRYARYSNFLIGKETNSYELESLGEYSGTADDALLQHLNSKFSTPDRSVEKPLNCAEIYKSGWWFNSGCYLCNLNGLYNTRNVDNSNAIEWRTWHFKPLKFVQMMIRPKTN
ncbi:fibrinogen-like protein 1 [Drosophila grimshawi]|uniref:fibrinogen-like protein 1 n=1 Tax=Drosophila grimshawi TaxID=7222 RepID=UPI000C86F529|nr:fibrinogen-like protein 1 [Drosophila grimshawi]